MRILIAAVGRSQKGAAETAAALNYLHQAGHLGAPMGFGPMTLREVEDRSRNSRPNSGEILRSRQREAELLLAEMPKGAKLAALDETGREMSSREFANWLGGTKDQGLRDLVFAIGGADGHGPSLLERSDITLSLGKLTWPHMLVRLMLTEQIYRAVSILANHPYHRG
ncbi:MAG TPA: 23S rRNA (pseudouridine(1915)-N(3))-methyltransferase RlmH [Alphaproteobacteria bacterium]|jgi:23S rRNA (pseudouridine1915-N3)-methyltransferase|nr:23S rRNA (pseudouridine(1915)-N(3))-methyltransferase RlmH [Alphaproteobacteria bacterium]